MAHTGPIEVTIIAFGPESHARGARMLRAALGPAIAGFLDDPAGIEVMLNPDGRLWLDRLSGGLEDTGFRLSPADGERIVRLVAQHVGAEVHAGAPRVSAAPACSSPTNACSRRRSRAYERFGLTDRQIEILSRATPKRDYYCQSRRGNRLFGLRHGEVALALSAKSDQAQIARLIAEHGREGFARSWPEARSVAWATDLLIGR